MKSRSLKPFTLVIISMALLCTAPLSCRLLVSQPIVYMAGYYFNPNGSKTACYWKNGERFDMPHSGGDWDFAYDIAVSNGRVILAGSHSANSGTTKIPCLWEGTRRIDLPSTANGGECYGIALSMRNIYCAGYYNSSAERAEYWVNNDYTALDYPLQSTNPARVFDIKVVNGTIYAAGFYFGSPDQVACYWVNGQLVALPVSPTAGALAWAIFVDGNTVYTAGKATVSTIETACYWVNQEQHVLNSEGRPSNAQSIYVAANKVYVAGSYTVGASPQPCLWINGARQDLPVPDGFVGSGQAILVLGGVPFVAGYYSSGSMMYACYWANGHRFDFPSGANPGDVFVEGICFTH